MNWLKVAKRLEGMHTTETISSELGIGRQTAINYIHILRARGFLETDRVGYSRLYRIRPYYVRSIGYDGLYETINKSSPIKIVPPYIHKITDHKLSAEETILRAILEKDLRLILASLYLFTQVTDWKSLYILSKKSSTERQAGALYELASRYFKVGEADKKTLEKMRRSKTKSKFIIEHVKSDDFKDIEKKWGIYIPFNKSDLDRYNKSM